MQSAEVQLTLEVFAPKGVSKLSPLGLDSFEMSARPWSQRVFEPEVFLL